MIETTLPSAVRQRFPPGSRIARFGYTGFAALFAVLLALQVFFAGLGALVGPSYWDWHRALGSMLILPTLLLLVLGPFARLPLRTNLLGALLLLLYVCQYLLLYVPPALGAVALRALHPVNALAMFWVAITLTRHGWQAFRASRPTQGADDPFADLAPAPHAR